MNSEWRMRAFISASRGRKRRRRYIKRRHEHGPFVRAEVCVCTISSGRDIAREYASTRLCSREVRSDSDVSAYTFTSHFHSTAMPRQARIHCVSLRSSLVNLPISIYGPLVERNIVRIVGTLTSSHLTMISFAATPACGRTPDMLFPQSQAPK